MSAEGVLDHATVNREDVMVTITTDGRSSHKLDFVENETETQLINRFKAAKGFHFKAGHSLQDTQTGRIIASSEIIMDNRLYYLNAWIIPA